MLKRYKRIKTSLIWLVAPLMLIACADTKPPTPTIATTDQEICLAWKKISYSGKGDTQQTIKEAIDNNAARAAFCKN